MSSSNSPRITWKIKKNYSDNYSLTNSDYYYGNINGSDGASFYIQIWNNYNGSIDVDNLKDATLIVKTLNIDDSYLLNLLSISSIVDGNETSITKTIINDVKSSFYIGTLYGYSNNGNEDSQESLPQKNMITLKVTIDKTDYKVKENLKNLVFSVIQGST